MAIIIERPTLVLKIFIIGSESTIFQKDFKFFVLIVILVKKDTGFAHTKLNRKILRDDEVPQF